MSLRLNFWIFRFSPLPELCLLGRISVATMVLLNSKSAFKNNLNAHPYAGFMRVTIRSSLFPLFFTAPARSSVTKTYSSGDLCSIAPFLFLCGCFWTCSGVCFIKSRPLTTLATVYISVKFPVLWWHDLCFHFTIYASERQLVANCNGGGRRKDSWKRPWQLDIWDATKIARDVFIVC